MKRQNAFIIIWLKGLRSFNILNGEVYESKFGNRNKELSLLQTAAMYPDKREVKLVRAGRVVDAKAAAAYSERVGRIFSIRNLGGIILDILFNNLNWSLS